VTLLAAPQDWTETLKALEWPEYLRSVAERARSLPGKALLTRLESPDAWARTPTDCETLQQETAEALELAAKDSLWGALSELESPDEAIGKLLRAGILELGELALLRRWWQAAEGWHTAELEPALAERVPLFLKARARVNDPSAPLRLLDTVLTPTGELSERASPKLAALFQELRSLRRQIDQVLDGVLKRLAPTGVLQDQFSDVRDGRYVIPVKISHQHEVDGILYESSASRHTVFIEPREVSAVNNRFRQKQNELLQEIDTLLRETSRKLEPHAPHLQTASLVLTHWDAVQARAEAARAIGGKRLRVTEARSFKLVGTAHPLLWRTLPESRIIRNTLEFGTPTLTLMLTGPNTGGKTVLLKTLGLAALFARTGFFIPAYEEATVPFVDRVFADLGDPQSLEQSLSSFSGHVLRFKRILEGLTDHSLVLIDELNTATDPEEGAALGRAVLETVLQRKALTVTTTHDPNLKALAFTDERILCASMAFDDASRMPTYQVLLGVPGRSRALETAERLGLPETVLQLARSYVTSQHHQFESLIEKLETDRREAERLRTEAETLRKEAAEAERKARDRLESGIDELLDRARLRMRRISDEAQEKVRDAVRQVAEARSLRDLDPVRQKIQGSLDEARVQADEVLRDTAPSERSAPVRKPELGSAEGASPFVVGAKVRVPKFKTQGELREVDLKGRTAKVQMGTLQMRMNLDELEVVSGPAPRARAGSVSQRPPAPPSQIDLRGLRFEMAMGELERYLDSAYRSGELRQVTVVHGLGTGAIREGTRALLAKLPYVREFRDGGQGFGGTGATLVEFEG
jgi:DNA mismatch repair protein MutS2